ncbi:hypothetical protein OSTOST_25311 [Ostertagia ostertagi]
MSTVLTRIEAILNTRPLTKLNSDDITEIPLRPIDFLQGNLKFSLPEGENYTGNDDPTYDPEFIQTREQAMEAIRFSENIANKFWGSPRHLQRTYPEIGEVVLIEQDLIPRGSWPYGKITEIITSSDGLIRSAKILMPNQNIIHRPLNKIYPLEIRSGVKESITNEIEGNNNSEDTVPDENCEEIDATRRMPPRNSKTRSLMISSGAWNAVSDLSFHFSSKQESSIISCAKGTVLYAMNAAFEVCMRPTIWQPLTNTTRPTKYILPILPTEQGVNVRLRTLKNEVVHEQSKTCDRPKFCDHQYFLSKSLLGNPHCWPVGAIATSAILIYLIIAARYGDCVEIAKSKKAESSTPKLDKKVERSEPSAPTCSFELAPLPCSTLMVVCAIFLMMSPINACQHGVMRHSAEQVCNELNHCHLEYSRELLFNKLQSELCIEIVHSNKTIGVAKITKKTVNFKCTKNIEFFTRPTKLQIYQVKRCALAGSCTTEKCETISPNETISELKRVAKYPGYSGCLNSCGGILCGCGLSLPACWFYRIVHKPISQRVFEIIQCPHWTPTITLEIEITLSNNTQKTYYRFKKPSHYIANKRFALSSNASYILPPDFQIPVACSSYTQAQNDFSTCTNQIRCNCGNSVHNCQCPDDSIRKLRDHTQYTLPLETPYAEIFVNDQDIFASTYEEEIVLRIESTLLQESTELVVNQECGFKITELTGCYDCEHGAHFTALCKSPSNATVTVTCESQQFLVKCGPSNESNVIFLNFEHPIVHEQCSAHCSENPTKFLLTGTLFYHIAEEQALHFRQENAWSFYETSMVQ